MRRSTPASKTLAYLCYSFSKNMPQKERVKPSSYGLNEQKFQRKINNLLIEELIRNVSIPRMFVFTTLR